MSRDISDFTQSCIHFIMSQTSERILRPLSNALHGPKYNEIVRADVLYIEPAADCEEKYGFVIKNDIISYKRL